MFESIIMLFNVKVFLVLLYGSFVWNYSSELVSGLLANKIETTPEKYLSCLIWQFNFRGIISSCFEPHLTVYIELEEKTLMENLEKLVQVN